MSSFLSGKLKIALIQLCATSNKEANLKNAVSLCEKALKKGAQFVLLPEVFNFRGNGRDKQIFAQVMEKVPGPSSTIFMALAKKYKATLLLGSIIEKADAQHGFNSSILINPHGGIEAKYRKIHLFDARIGDKIVREKDCFKPGRRPVRAKVGPFRMGLSICYDLRFPDLYQQYARRGVEILTIPSCFTRKTGEAHWEALLKARAIETLSYVLAPNQIGTDARGMQAHGHSMIISPWGKIIARGSADKEEIVEGEISFDEIGQARHILPGIILNDLGGVL